MRIRDNFNAKGSEVTSMKVFIIANSGFAIYNFRKLLTERLVSTGHKVYVICPNDDYSHRLANLGAHHIPLKLSVGSKNPLREFVTFLQIAYAIFSYGPDICLTFTIKPNLYVGLIRQFKKFRYIPNVTGLGDTFDTNQSLFLIIRSFLRIAFKRAFLVFFQNKNDREIYKKHKILHSQPSVIIPGSGFDIQSLKFIPKKFDHDEPFTFLFIGRLLKKKGISDYLKAALKLQNEPNLQFKVVGEVHLPIPGLNNSETEKIIAAQSVDVIGFAEDPSPFYQMSHCVVLPSYYNEGVPRVLIEALAHGCLIITTDRPGCKDTVDNYSNGFLCAAENFEELAAKMLQLSKLSKATLQRMSAASRKKAYLFDEQIVVSQYMKAIDD